MAASLTAGAAALVIQAFRELAGVEPSPLAVKNVLMCAARDLGEDPLSQGAGRVDVLEAVKTIAGEAKPLVVTADTWDSATELIEEAWNTSIRLPASYTRISWPPISSGIPLANLFVGTVEQGRSRTATVYVFNPTGETKRYVIEAWTYTRVYVAEYKVGSVPPPSPGYAVNRTYFVLPSLPRAKYVTITVWHDVEDLEEGEYFYVFLWDWVDEDGDGEIDPSTELYRVDYDAATGNVHCISFGFPTKIFAGKPVLEFVRDCKMGVRPISAGMLVEGWRPTSPMWVRVRPRVAYVPPGGTAEVKIVFRALRTMLGPYTGFVQVRDADTGEVAEIPFSFVAVGEVRRLMTASTYRFVYPLHRPYPYHVLMVRGLYDWNQNREVGDWRLIEFEIDDPRDEIVAVRATIKWLSPKTDIDALAVTGSGWISDVGNSDYLSGKRFQWGTRTGRAEEYVWIHDQGVDRGVRRILLCNALYGGDVKPPEYYAVYLDFVRARWRGGCAKLHEGWYAEARARAGQVITLYLKLTSTTPVDVILEPAAWNDLPVQYSLDSFTLCVAKVIKVQIAVPEDAPPGTYRADTLVYLDEMATPVYLLVDVVVG